jgi:polysaccharide export outer membrane protein
MPDLRLPRVGRGPNDLTQEAVLASKMHCSKHHMTIRHVLLTALTIGWAICAERPAGKVPEIASQPAVADHRAVGGYRIGAGDVLQIVVWKEPDASVPAVVVRPDGKIAMPLLKDVGVLGLTPAEAEQALTERLSKFIPAADVTVVVTAIHSKRVYLVGGVKKEGPIELQHDMSVLQALSEAGGLTDYAKRKSIYVLRTSNGSQHKLPFNYDAVLKGERIQENIFVEPDDIIVVPH